MMTTASLGNRPLRHLHSQKQAVDWHSPADGDGIGSKGCLEHA